MTDDNEYYHNGVKLNFEPAAWWFQCQICKVLIEHEDKFMVHKLTKHPPPSSDSESETEEKDDDNTLNTSQPEFVDLDSSSDSNDDAEDEDEIMIVAEIDSQSPDPTVVKTEPLSTLLENVPLKEQWKYDVFSQRGPSPSEKVIETNVDDRNTATSSTSTTTTANTIDKDIQLADQSTEQDGRSSVSTVEIDEKDLDAIEAPVSSEVNLESKPVAEESTPNVVEATEEQQKYSCCICSKQFYYRANLNCHLSVKHLCKKDQKGNLKCGLCPKTFPTRKQLGSHSWIHTNEKPFKCPSCKQGFLLRRQYQAHTKLCRKLPFQMP